MCADTCRLHLRLIFSAGGEVERMCSDIFERAKKDWKEKKKNETDLEEPFYFPKYFFGGEFKEKKGITHRTQRTGIILNKEDRDKCVTV